MLKGIKVRIYPKQAQVEHIEQNIGNARFVWNQLLNMWNTRYQNNPGLPTISKYDLQKFLPLMKKEHAFLKVSESSSLQTVSENLHVAFVAFFKQTRKHPKFKAKNKVKADYTIKNNQNIELYKSAIKLPKIGWVKARWSDNLTFDTIKRVTVSRTPSGDYQASVLVESESQTIDKTGQPIGLDMGQTDLLIWVGWITYKDENISGI